MTSPDVPADGQPAGRISIRPQSLRLNARRRQAFSAGSWPATRRLVAIIVMAVAIGLAAGGLRVASEVGAAAGFGRTAQLAALGQQVSGLAAALENERDLTAAVDAGGGWDSVNKGVPAVSAAELTSISSQLARAQAATNVEGAKVSALAGAIGSSFPAATQNAAAQVAGQISNLAGLRSESAGQPSLSAVSNYNGTLADLFALNEEITSGTGDPVLADDVRTLDAMSRAKDQASQQRAILYAALLNGQYTSGAQQTLLTSQGLENEYLLAFESSATSAEQNTYLSAVAGLPVDSAQLLNNYLGTQAGTSGRPAGSGKNPCTGAKVTGSAATASGLGMAACKLGRSYGVGAAQTYYTDMTRTIAGMRTVETQVASAIVARSQALRSGAVRSAVLTAAVTVAIALVLLAATLLAARSNNEARSRRRADL